ncbi:ABC transporter permease subunit [Pseudonocardia lacus]|uniref:ABC transporter permease subunit n=1 Tax=Pseudonocardia lacus TaxID=2835865 RepID=UPI001BDC2DE0|nr:ABC transporter permease subunit [Pseudonocardia lacus]
MTWLTWRQLRGSVVGTAAALVALAAALVLTGPGLAAEYSAGVAACTPVPDTCDRFFDRFFSAHELPFVAVSLLVLLLPALVGLFWGAPLIARELEAGTHLLVWNQSITRTRWLAVKLAITGLAAMVAAYLCGLVVTWWSFPLDMSAPDDLALMAPLVFGARGIAPVGYAVLAFVLGVTVGMLVRRALPAMAITLAVFFALQLAVPLLVRPHLMTPVTATFELSTENVAGFGAEDAGSSVGLRLQSAVPGDAGAWVLSSRVLDPSGRVVAETGEDAPVPVSMTSGPCAPQNGFASCIVEVNDLGFRQQATYHPLDRFWPFQWMETGIYAALALALTGFCFRWVRRRLS